MIRQVLHRSSRTGPEEGCGGRPAEAARLRSHRRGTPAVDSPRMGGRGRRHDRHHLDHAGATARASSSGWRTATTRLDVRALRVADGLDLQQVRIASAGKTRNQVAGSSDERDQRCRPPRTTRARPATATPNGSADHTGGGHPEGTTNSDQSNRSAQCICIRSPRHLQASANGNGEKHPRPSPICG
jgi:hypothetical protein